MPPLFRRPTNTAAARIAAEEPQTAVLKAAPADGDAAPPRSRRRRSRAAARPVDGAAIPVTTTPVTTTPVTASPVAAAPLTAPPDGEAAPPEGKAPGRRRRRSSRARKAEPGAEAELSAPGALAPLSIAPSVPLPPAAELVRLLKEQAALIRRQTDLLDALLNAPGRGGRPVPLEGTVEVRPRLAIFVDVPNILYAAERSGVDLDWGKVLDFLSTDRRLVRAVAYAPISDDPAAQRENERFVVPFVDHGYRIVTKPLKRFTGGAVKANFDVELAIDILTMADRLDVICLLSGDGDFRRVLDIVGSRGVRVEVMAFGQSTSRELREGADRYIDMAAYVPELSKR